jgi:NADP-dependent 3-hydroxy acid dehydrogenase YdfG
MSTAKLAYYGEMKVLITGASSGIGKATALYLAENGVAAICLFARRPERLDELAQELKETYPYVKTLVVAGDASNAADNKRAVDEAVAAFGGLTAAFINAGVYHGSMPLTETPDAVVEEIIDVYVCAVWHLYVCVCCGHSHHSVFCLPGTSAFSSSSCSATSRESFMDSAT